MLYFECLQHNQYELLDCPQSLQAALPPLYGSISFTHLEENYEWLN